MSCGTTHARREARGKNARLRYSPPRQYTYPNLARAGDLLGKADHTHRWIRVRRCGDVSLPPRR